MRPERLADPEPERPVDQVGKGRAGGVELASIARRTRPLVLARDELLPVAPPLAELLGTPGLPRGSTVVLEGSGVAGGTSLALALLAGPSSSGAWCAVVGMPSLGLVAAAELGVALERLVLVPHPGRRFAAVVAALLEGCDVVVARPPAALARGEARRLVARARERRAALLIAAGTVATLPDLAPGAPGRSRPGEGRVAASVLWPEPAEVRLSVVAGSRSGIGRGTGRLGPRPMEVVATRRRASPPEVSVRLVLPLPAGGSVVEALPPPAGWVGRGSPESPPILPASAR
ncbi:MAG TPA: hypothetical protein VMU75_07440 [Acidimicrobiales bacterium]|nr:hypothetical protein [Acidimicrobiales bacterium]